MQQWQLASVLFLLYLAIVALLPRGLAAGRQWKVFAGVGLGATALAVSVALAPDGFANVWLLPAAVLLIGYWTSGLLFVAPMPRAERWLVALDTSLRIDAIAARSPRAVAELLEFAYSGIYPLILVSLYFALQAGVTVDRFWTTIVVTDYICFGVLPWFQTRPPRSLGFETPWRAAWRAINERILAGGSIQVNTFPSGHAAEGLATALLVTGAPLPIVAWMFFNALAVSAGAVLGRYHYAADAIAGWVVALLVWSALRL